MNCYYCPNKGELIQHGIEPENTRLVCKACFMKPELYFALQAFCETFKEYWKTQDGECVLCGEKYYGLGYCEIHYRRLSRKYGKIPKFLRKVEKMPKRKPYHRAVDKSPLA